jgi:hypothetical protein
MRRRRIAVAVLHLVLGGFFGTPDVGAFTPDDVSDDGADCVVDVVLGAPDESGQRNVARLLPDPGETAAALIGARVEVAIVHVQPDLPHDAARHLVAEALTACRDAGTLKVRVSTTPALDARAVRALAGPLGFQFARVRKDDAVELYRDLYAKAARAFSVHS